VWIEEEGRWGRGRKEKGGGERKCQLRQGKGGFIDGSHEWGREGRGDCGIRVGLVIEESGVVCQNQALLLFVNI